MSQSMKAMEGLTPLSDKIQYLDLKCQPPDDHSSHCNARHILYVRNFYSRLFDALRSCGVNIIIR